MSSGDSVSETTIKAIVTGMLPAVAKESLGIVDVRDVALAHLKAIQVDEAKNQRFTASEGDYWQKDFAAMLAEEFVPRGFKVTTAEAPTGQDHMDKTSNARARAILGIEFRSVKQAGVDMVNSLIKSGKIAAPQ